MQQLGQLIMIGIAGHSLSEDEKKFILQNNICGVTLFARNISDPEQVRQLCKEIQSLRFQSSEKTPFFIGIDQEGGRVARLKAPFTQWPPMRKLGDLDSPSVSFQFAYAMGQELKACGINLNYAPCVDTFTNPQNSVIGDRALSSDPEIVAKHASAIIRGFIKADILPCAKHFPGHGNTLLDSHHDLPIEELDLQSIQNRELLPFKKAIKSRIELLMTSHILFKNIDAKFPVTFSEIFLKKILREECRYKGLVVTDDLGMHALTKHFTQEEIPVRAIQAGCDLLLYCNEPSSPPLAIESLKKAISQGAIRPETITAIHSRILAVKKNSLTIPDPLDKEAALKIIGHTDHFKLAQAIQAGSVPAGLITAD